MEKFQENKLSMYISVQQVTNFHSEAWGSFKVFKDQFSGFEGLIEKILELRKIQEGKITGVTKDKAAAAYNAVEKGLIVQDKLSAYGSIIDDNKLIDRVSYSFSKLINSRDTFIINRLQIIHENASKYISELADYELTQEDLDELESLITRFRSIVENPRQAITNRARATSEIKVYFAEADKVLKCRLDKLINHYKASNSAFWKQYKSARKIIDLGHRKREERSVEKEMHPATA